jgi:murein DD-endopeptidase MepM/ murein hydrolase activator NlpD
VGAVLCGLATVALQRLVGPWGLPLMVLPFNLVVLTLLCAMRQRGRDRFPSAVGFAPGSPERNLRFHQTRILRAQAGKEAGGGVAFGLPFRGAWICTQGIDGPHTHQGPWRHAFDFEVAGQDGWLQVPGGADRDPSRYHCYGLPVLAAADGTVVRVEEDVPDNAVGAVNLERNWGNVVVLVHAPGVYSLVAHLAPGSAAVREGQVVRRGEVVGLCGNSGRSPRPHLHFQLQATPVLGAPTLPCAFESGVLTGASPARLLAGFVPREGETWKNPEPFPELAEQLVFAPGTSAVYRVNQRVERIASEIDLFGQPLLRSDRGGVLTFARTAAQFTVLDVEGPADSALVLLRAALGRVPLAADPSACWHDQLPPAFGAGRTWRWLREILAPFLPGQGLPIEYRCLHEGGRLAIEGRSLRADAQGAPAAFSRARLAPGGWPDVVELSLACGPCARAERIPQPAAPAPRTRSSVAERRRAVAIPPLPPPLSRVIPLSDRIRARRFDDREA